MSRRLTLLFAAAEAGLIVAIGIAIPLVPLTVLWALHFGFGVDWAVFWRAALDLWLIGHGVDVTFRMDADAVAALGIAGAGDPIRITIALLGLGLVTLLLAVRAGRRIADTGHRILGTVVSVAVVALLSFGLTGVSLHDDARPSLVQAGILPPLVFGVGVLTGLLWARLRRAPTPRATPLARRADDLRQFIPLELRIGLVAAFRGGLGTAALLVAASSVVLAATLVGSYAEIIRLYEALHGEVLGGVVVTTLELGLVPNFIAWTMSWLIGPGFALGAGSSVSPIGTSLGPVPAIPILGALPSGDFSFAFLGLIVPVTAALLVGAGVRRVTEREALQLPLAGWVAVAVGAGLVAGLATGLFAAISAGSAGPGRLGVVGPDGVTVGIVVALITALAGGAGLWLGSTRRSVRVAAWRPGREEAPRESDRERLR